MARLSCLICCLAMLASQSQAGAWLRTEGSAFLSFGGKVTVTDGTSGYKTDQDIYAEYGLRPNLTIGGSATVSPGPEGLVSLATKGEAQVFLRLPANLAEGPSKVSFEIGLGGQYANDMVEGFVKTGVSWGRGITAWDKSGWVNIDASFHLPLGALEQAFKLDATVGLSVSDRVQIMAQGFAEADRFGQSITLSPSVIIATKNGKSKYVGSLEKRIGRLEGYGVKLSVWREF